MSNVLLIFINGRCGTVSSRYVFHFKLRLVHFLPYLTRDSLICMSIRVCVCVSACMQRARAQGLDFCKITICAAW